MTRPAEPATPDELLPSDAVVRELQALAVLPDAVAERHLALLGAALRGATPLVPANARRRAVRRAGTAAAVAAMASVLIGGVGVAAASSAAPGDTLYGLKTARERLVLAMTAPGDDRARAHLEQARTRLDEAAALLSDGDARRAIETLAQADAALAAATAQGSDEVDTDAHDALGRRVEVLSALLAGGLPDQAAGAAREAISDAVARDERGAPGRSGSHPTPRPEPTRRPIARLRDRAVHRARSRIPARRRSGPPTRVDRAAPRRRSRRGPGPPRPARRAHLPRAARPRTALR